jgi:anti-anti-sigma regulatory factor
MRTVVRVFSGEYDLTHKWALRAEFDAVCLEPNLILDMRGVTYLDSTCVTELLRLNKCRGEKDLGQVTIVRSAFIVKRIFGILYFRTLFRLVDTLKEVLPNDCSAVVVQYACRGDRSALQAQPEPALTEVPSTDWDSLTPLWLAGRPFESTH